MAFLPVSGTDGRLQVDGGPVYGIKSWKLDKKTAPILIPNFESPVDDNGLVYPNVLAGLSGATVSGEGFFDCGNVTDSTVGITNGNQVTLDLYVSKNLVLGYLGLIVLITDFGPGTNVENQAASFSFQGTINGICPQST
jgi:hypothetical protein